MLYKENPKNTTKLFKTVIEHARLTVNKMNMQKSVALSYAYKEQEEKLKSYSIQGHFKK